MAVSPDQPYMNGHSVQDITPPATAGDIPRTRQRRGRIKFDPQEIFSRVERFYQDDLIDYDVDRDRRIQREAKFRMWAEGKSVPWDGASDVTFPDMMEKSLRVQDTLHNAVMSQSPPVNAKANNPADKNKQRTCEKLLMHQFFVDCEGERIVGEMADAFVNDGTLVVYTPWVEDHRKIVDVREFSPLPPDVPVDQFFRQVLTQIFGSHAEIAPVRNGKFWDWTVDYDDKDGERRSVDVSFYTSDSSANLEVVIKTEATVFDGPVPMVIDDDDLFAPPRCANLQIPTPANPKGAPHVILRDYPTIDQIRNLIRSGYYDAVAVTGKGEITKSVKDVLDELENYQRSGSDEEMKDAKDAIQGAAESQPSDDRTHRTLTRLMCFDLYDCDDDGINEDVIWWVILEAKLVVRARYLTEVYPFNPPARPFQETQFIPVRGRRKGISLLEMLESMHDLMKKTMDQAIDANDLAINPFFFYRKTAAMSPAAIRLWPGEGYPLSDPQRDVMFPQVGNPQAMGFALNLFTLVGQQEERVSIIGDAQFGRVPAGKSSALRTVGGAAMLQAQGEARPERLLRRFFMCFTKVWESMHMLNTRLLPKDKQIHVLGPLETGEDPYQTISDRGAIGGKYMFTFKANVLNTSKDALGQALEKLMGAFVSPLAIQLGLVNQDGIYRMFRDYATANGQDVDEYLVKPTPDSDKPKITAEMALAQIANDTMPDGAPAEGLEAHAAKVFGFKDTNDFGIFTPTQVSMYAEYLKQLEAQYKQMQQQQQMQQAAQQFQQQMTGRQGGQGGAPTTQGPPGMATQKVSSGNELVDKALPTAGGGTIQ